VYLREVFKLDFYSQIPTDVIKEFKKDEIHKITVEGLKGGETLT